MFNKKAFLDDALDLLIIVGSLVLLWIFISSIMSESITARSQLAVNYADQSLAENQLILFLRSPLTFNDQTLTMEDFIILFLEGRMVSQDIFEEIIKNQMPQYFPENYQCGYNLYFSDQNHVHKFQLIVSPVARGIVCSKINVKTQILGNKLYYLELKSNYD